MLAATSTALDDIVLSFDAKTACALPCNAHEGLQTAKALKIAAGTSLLLQ